MITFPSGFESMDGLFQFEDLDPWNSFSSSINNDNTGNQNHMSSNDMLQEKMDLEFDKFFLEESFSQEFSYEPSSSLSSKGTLSVDSSDRSADQILRTNSISSNSKLQILDPFNPILNKKISNLDSDDDAITKAMVSIISSTSSNSSSNSPIQIYNKSEKQTNIKGHFGSFMPIKSFVAPKYEVNFENNGQKMIKKSLCMLRNIGSDQVKESKPTNLHHMISERKRREKLNESFETLRMLLPPGSKKDKTSVLINTTSYLKTLESQITNLKEKNRKLEAYFPNLEGTNNTIMGLNQRAQVHISKTKSPKSEVLQINLGVTAMTECDIIELVLSILECLKFMKVISLVAVDAYTFSPKMNLHAKASVKLQIKDSDWNEALFQQAMQKAVDDIP